jgi:TonB family protein
MRKTLWGAGATAGWLVLAVGTMAQAQDRQAAPAPEQIAMADAGGDAVMTGDATAAAPAEQPASAVTIESPEAIEERHRAALDACWERATGAAAPVTVRLAVNGSGRVSSASVDGEAARAVERCLAREARRLTFPVGSSSGPAPAATTTVEYRLEPRVAAAPAATPAVEASAVVGAARGPSTIRGSAQLGSVSVRGGTVGPSVLESLVRQNVGSLSGCHAHALAQDPSARGTATVRFEVGADGRVTDATVRTTFRGANVESCIRDAVRQWAVSMPIGSNARVTMQVDLVPRLRW